jgi:putative endonuclease
MKKEYQFYVYIMASINGTLYTGVTNCVFTRSLQHKEKINEGFSEKYKCQKLLYYEEHQYINDAIAREKQIKKWRREKKIALIKTMNPQMTDLAFEWRYD